MSPSLGEIDGVRLPIERNGWVLKEDDFTLYAMLSDPVYMPELVWKDPTNHEYAGAYRVRPEQYQINRCEEQTAIFACGRATGKTQGQKSHSQVHCFTSPAEDMLMTAPELIHLLPLTDAVEDSIRDSRLLRECLDQAYGRTGFTHRPFGCLAEGTLVLTERGHVPIETVAAGDYVLTHKSRWRRVTHVWDRGVQDVVTLRGTGMYGLTATPDHNLFARRVIQKEGVGATGKRVMKWVPSDPEWIPIEDWKTTEPASRMAFPTRLVEDFPGCVPPPFRLNKSGFGVGHGALVEPTNLDFLWVLGHYLAEGCLASTKAGASPSKTIFAIHKDEVETVVERIQRIGAHGGVYPNVGEGRQVVVGNEPLARFFDTHAAGYAQSKDLAPWVYTLSDDQRKAVLEGYLYGDGHFNGIAWDGGSASEALSQSMVLLAHTLGWAAGVSFKEPKQGFIDGKAVNTDRQYQWYLRPEPAGTHVHTTYDLGLAWTAATRLVNAGRTRVYDLTVEEDHSFVAQGVFVANSNFTDGTKLVGRIPKLKGTGVLGQHSPFVMVEEAQSYPEPGWKNLEEVVNYDAVDKYGRPRWRYWAFGVHDGNRQSGFSSRAKSEEWKVIQVTRLQRSDWGKEAKERAKASYGSTSSPDYRRNILGEPGDAASAYFVTARLMSCVDQRVERGEVEGSDYNNNEYKHQLFRAEELDAVRLHIADALDLPHGYESVYGGCDVGLNRSPTVISLFTETMVSGKLRLKLFRRFTLERFRSKQIRQALYAIDLHFGGALMGMGVDSTGLGLPLMQEMEDDEVCPPHLMQIMRGYFFSSKVAVAVAPENVYRDEATGIVKDQYGRMLEEQTLPDGSKRFIVWAPFITASTNYLAKWVDTGYLLLPFDQEVIQDMLGETKERVERLQSNAERAGGALRKPDIFHILDSFRGMAMSYHATDIEEALAIPQQRPVYDEAF